MASASFWTDPPISRPTSRVNLPARLCDLAEHAQIGIGASTASALEESPDWRRDLVMVPGLEDPIEVIIEDTLADPDSLLLED